MSRTLRTNAEVTSDLQEIRRILPDVWRSYGLAMDFAFSGSVSGEGGRSAIGDSDPTGQVAISRNAARSRVRLAGHKVADALSKLREAEAALDRAVLSSDRMGYQETPRFSPSLITRQELAETHEAQERRVARGEM